MGRTRTGLRRPGGAPDASSPLRRCCTERRFTTCMSRTVRKMVPFAGYEMPVQYASGVLKEHLHTRAAAGLFDVSHMGQIAIRPRSGSLNDAAAALERLLPADIVGLGRRTPALRRADQRAGRHPRRPDGGQSRRSSHAGGQRRHQGCRRGASARAISRRPARSSRAGAGAAGAARAARRSGAGGHDPTIATMRFMDVRPARIAGIECLVSRSGYTGEDGFEISVPADGGRSAGARAAAARSGGADRAGGARQPAARGRACASTDRISMPSTNPVEAALEWTIPKARRSRRQPRGRLPGRRHGAGRARDRSRAAGASACGPKGARRCAPAAQLYADAACASADRRRHLRRLRAEPGGADRDGLRRARTLRSRARGCSPSRARRAPAGRW